MSDADEIDNVLGRIQELAGLRPNAPALIDVDGKPTSYREFVDAAHRIATRLVDEGVARGDRVMIVGSNTPEFLIGYFGIMYSGAVVVPLNMMLTGTEVKHQIDQVTPTVAIAAPDAPPEHVEVLRAAIPTHEYVAFISAEPSTSTLPALPDADAPAAILLSSGSSGGGPKGVVHTHGSIAHATSEFLRVMPIAEDDVTIGFLPFYTAIGEQILPILCRGAAVLPLPRFDIAEIERVCQWGTTFDIIPTLMARLINEADLSVISAIRWVMFASEPMPPALLARWAEELPTVELHEFYGMTEVLNVTYASPQVLKEDPTTVGRAFPSSRVFVVDENDNELPPGQIGEIICSSRARMAGYYRDEEATAAVLLADGSLRTGDLGYLNENGTLVLTGRIKDIIVSGGMNVAPAEIEAALSHHPRVLTAAVLGVASERWGETPVAVVVPVPGQTVTAEEIHAYCRENLAGFKRPSAIAIVDELPRTGIGKIAKNDILKSIESGNISLKTRV